MSKYTDLLRQIKEDAGGGAVGGGGAVATGMVAPAVAADGNTSIAYLPGGFKKNKKKEKVPGTTTVEEQRSELVHSLYSKLMRALAVDLRDNKQVKKTIILLNYWLSLFPQSKYLQPAERLANT